jgi:protein involved in sex pheromone biosynthesis
MMKKWMAISLVTSVLALTGCHHMHKYDNPGHDPDGPGNSENAPGHQ